MAVGGSPRDETVGAATTGAVTSAAVTAEATGGGAAGATEFRWDRLTTTAALTYCLLTPALGSGVVLPDLIDEFHLSGVVAALHGSMFGIGLLLVGIWGVPVLDRHGRRTTMAWSVLAMCIGVALFAVGPAWPITLLGTALSGTGGAVMVMAIPRLISDHHGEHRAHAFTLVNAAPLVTATAFSLAVGGVLGAGWSWRPVFLVFMAAVVIALLTAAAPVVLPTTERHTVFSLAHFADRTVLMPWLQLVNAVLVEFTVGVWSVTYLRDVGGTSAGWAPVLACLYGLSMTTVRLAAGRVIRRTGEATRAWSFVVAGSGALLMWAGPGLALKVLGLVITGLGTGLLYPRAESVLDSVSLGAYAALGSGVAITLGPVALGAVADAAGLRDAILVIPALALLGAFTQWPRH